MREGPSQCSNKEKETTPPHNWLEQRYELSRVNNVTIPIRMGRLAISKTTFLKLRSKKELLYISIEKKGVTYLTGQMLHLPPNIRKRNWKRDGQNQRHRQLTVSKPTSNNRKESRVPLKMTVMLRKYSKEKLGAEQSRLIQTAILSELHVCELDIGLKITSSSGRTIVSR